MSPQSCAFPTASRIVRVDSKGIPNLLQCWKPLGPYRMHALTHGRVDTKIQGPACMCEIAGTEPQNRVQTREPLNPKL